MKLYNYNKKTKEFLSESEAKENPLEKGKYLVPANATTKKPLVEKENFAVCFMNNAWEYVVDNREEVYYINSEEVIFDLGDEITSDMTKEQFTQEELDKQAQAELKQYILKAVGTMAVGEDVDGTYVLFDGNDEATSNIHKAITSLVADETTPWKVYNNTVVTVNQTILKKVLRKAGIVKTKLWFCKTKEEVDEIVSYHQEWLDKFTKTDKGRGL